MRPSEVILAPLITEKAMFLRQAENRYVFRVAPRASKPSIRRAVESLFGVKVRQVHTLIQRGHWRRSGRNASLRSNWKKAVVTLNKGESIKSLEGVS